MRKRILFGLAAGLLIAWPTLAQNSGSLWSYLQSQYTSGASGDNTEPTRTLSFSASTTNSDSMPSRGMSMKQVESAFGQPADRRSPVGDPPITRWEYQSFVVYFEYRHVIHSVEKH